jgi:hypothetical protein
MGKLIDFDSMAHVRMKVSYNLFRTLQKRRWEHRLTTIFKQDPL